MSNNQDNGNAAAIREAAAEFVSVILDKKPGIHNLHRLAEKCRDALAKPPRNCDRFRSEAEAKSAFIAYYNEAFDLKGSNDEIDTCDLKHDVDGILHDYIQWLFAPAAELKGEN